MERLSPESGFTQFINSVNRTQETASFQFQQFQTTCFRSANIFLFNIDKKNRRPFVQVGHVCFSPIPYSFC